MWLFTFLLNIFILNFHFPAYLIKNVSKSPLKYKSNYFSNRNPYFFQLIFLTKLILFGVSGCPFLLVMSACEYFVCRPHSYYWLSFDLVHDLSCKSLRLLRMLSRCIIINSTFFSIIVSTTPNWRSTLVTVVVSFAACAGSGHLLQVFP